MHRLISFAAVIVTAAFACGTIANAAPSYITPDARAVATRYVQGTSSLQTTSLTAVPIPGLQLVLPVMTTTSRFALVTLNLPNSYNFGACTIQVVAAGIVYGTGLMGSGFPTSTTIVTKIPLTTATQVLQGYWFTGSESCSISTFYSLSVILTVN